MAISYPETRINKKQMLKRITSSPLYLKLFVWEYWPMPMAILPLIFYWLWFSIRARHPFFFTAVNPSIETGGWMGESKINILKKLPTEYLPKTVFVPKGTPWETVHSEIQEKEIYFPLIAKPDIGKRGLQVLKISQEEMLKKYHAQSDMDFMVQEFIELPIEAGIFYHRHPGQAKGAITSICLKDFLHVKGDGHSTIRNLMEKDQRASLQINRFEQESPELLAQIPGNEEKVLLEPIGNHSRGTKFLSGNHLIDPELTAVFDQVSQHMDGIHYGRFDMKCSSLDAVRQGKGFKVLEFNGVAADPAHVFDPAIPIWKKYRDYFRHWKTIFRIYRVQRKRGIKAMSTGAALRSWYNYWRYVKRVE